MPEKRKNQQVEKPWPKYTPAGKRALIKALREAPNAGIFGDEGDVFDADRDNEGKGIPIDALIKACRKANSAR